MNDKKNSDPIKAAAKKLAENAPRLSVKQREMLARLLG